MQTNGNYYKNKTGKWQKIPLPGSKYPAWSQQGSIKDPVIMKKVKPVKCAYCGKEKIAIAQHPTSKKIKFCSVEHGKLYMVTHPDTRYK